MAGNKGWPLNDHNWHLREAERLLEKADKADRREPRSSMRRWSYMERAQAHIALAKQL